MQIWEILVPYSNNKGEKFVMKHHKEWDAFVKKLTGGITILRTSKGEWISPSGQLYAERMIPCRIMCTEDQIDKIVDFTIDHYKQEAVIWYKISDEVFLRHKK